MFESRPQRRRCEVPQQPGDQRRVQLLNLVPDGGECHRRSLGGQQPVDELSKFAGFVDEHHTWLSFGEISCCQLLRQLVGDLPSRTLERRELQQAHHEVFAGPLVGAEQSDQGG